MSSKKNKGGSNFKRQKQGKGKREAKPIPRAGSNSIYASVIKLTGIYLKVRTISSNSEVNNKLCDCYIRGAVGKYAFNSLKNESTGNIILMSYDPNCDIEKVNGEVLFVYDGEQKRNLIWQGEIPENYLHTLPENTCGIEFAQVLPKPPTRDKTKERKKDEPYVDLDTICCSDSSSTGAAEEEVEEEVEC